MWIIENKGICKGMEMETVLELIEMKKKQLHVLAKRYELNHKEVINISQELDYLINQYIKINAMKFNKINL